MKRSTAHSVARLDRLTGYFRRDMGKAQRPRIIMWWRRVAIAVRRAISAYNADNCSSFANAIAYNALLALVPLTVFALALAALFLRDPATQEQVRNALLDNLPITTAAGRTQLRDAISTIAKTRPALGIFSLALAAYAARGVILHLRTGLSIAFRLSRRRSLVRGVLFDLGMATGLGLLLLFSLALTLGIAVAQRADAELFGWSLPMPVTAVLSLLYSIAPALISLVVFAVIYRVFAHGYITWREVLPGAILASVAFEVVKIGFAQYAARVGTASMMSAVLGFVVAFLALPHFGSQIVLFGAEFARVYRDLGVEQSRSSALTGDSNGEV